MISLAAVTSETMAEILGKIPIDKESGFIDVREVAKMKAMEFLVSMFEAKQQVSVAA